MSKRFKSVNGSVVAARGFLASGVFCDIKRLGTGKGSNKGPKRDLAILHSEVPCSVAGMFTTNQICAAPVKVCTQRIKGGVARTVVVNSANANACTGRQGMSDAKEMTRLAAAELGVVEKHVFVGSTGRIGVTMPMPNVRAGIVAATRALSSSDASAAAAAEAIMTSDSHHRFCRSVTPPATEPTRRR